MRSELRPAAPEGHVVPDLIPRQPPAGALLALSPDRQQLFTPSLSLALPPASPFRGREHVFTETRM